MLSATGVPFESAAQREAHARLRSMLERLFPGLVRERIHAIGYVMTLDDTTVTCTLAPWGDDETTLAIRVYLAGAVPMTVEVLRELARWTTELRFSVFGVDAADNVYVEYQLVPSTMTDAILGRSIREVLALAVERHDEFRSRFGGSDL
jgi:hypothetical protein